MTMPHINGTSSAAGDDLGSSDEIKVFKVESEEKDEERLSSSEVLTEDKSSLITVCEGPEGEGKSSSSEQNYGSPKEPLRPESSPLFGRGLEPLSHASSFGYFMSPAYAAYTNGVGMGVSAAAAASLSAASMAGKMGIAPPHAGSPLSFFYPGADPLSQPPPAHMGIPPYQLDPKSPGGLTSIPRPPMYHFPTAQYTYPMLGAEMAQMASWHTQGMYPISSGAGFRSPYPTGLQLTATTLPRFSPSFLAGHHPSLGAATHPALLSPGHPAAMSSLHHGRPESGLHMGILGDHAQRNLVLGDKGPTTSSGEPGRPADGSSNNQDKKKPHIKKPLNAFMLYMKEMRAKVVAECTLKESAAINQILGRRWHTLSREEQARYYEMARQQRQIHMQLYPSWSLRDSHNSTSRKKKRKRDKTAEGGNNLKKCRARYGLDQQSQWCKPCRRKKKCIRYLDNGEGETEDGNEDPLGSVGEEVSPNSKHNDESDDSSDDEDTSASDLGMSSPGMSLSSLASPAVLPSPSASLASPLTPSPATPSMPSHHSFLDKPLGPPNRVPIGTNPHDINNPLSVNQLCGNDKNKESSHTMLSVT